MYALDTATVTALSYGKNETLNQRVQAAADNIWLPIIVVQEQLNGRFRTINKLKPDVPSESAKIPIAFQDLIKAQLFLSKFSILPYTPEDEALYQSLPASVKRIGLNDCRIAVSAINRGFTVVTCNIQHFEKIPNVKCVDWTVTQT